jgi:hypothetical protein
VHEEGFLLVIGHRPAASPVRLRAGDRFRFRALPTAALPVPRREEVDDRGEEMLDRVPPAGVFHDDQQVTPRQRFGAEVVESAADLQQFVLDPVAVLRYELAEPCDSPNEMSEDSPHACMMPSSWSAPSIASNRPGA